MKLMLDVKNDIMLSVAQFAEEQGIETERAFMLLVCDGLDAHSAKAHEKLSKQIDAEEQPRTKLAAVKTYSAQSVVASAGTAKVSLAHTDFDSGLSGAIEKYRSRDTFVIGDLYNLAARVRDGVEFTMNALIESLPSDLRARVSEDQIRGWPVSFHKKMVKEDYRFRKEDGPIIYWYP